MVEAGIVVGLGVEVVVVEVEVKVVELEVVGLEVEFNWLTGTWLGKRTLLFVVLPLTVGRVEVAVAKLVPLVVPFTGTLALLELASGPALVLLTTRRSSMGDAVDFST